MTWQPSLSLDIFCAGARGIAAGVSSLASRLPSLHVPCACRSRKECWGVLIMFGDKVHAMHRPAVAACPSGCAGRRSDRPDAWRVTLAH